MTKPDLNSKLSTDWPVAMICINKTISDFAMIPGTVQYNIEGMLIHTHNSVQIPLYSGVVLRAPVQAVLVL